VKVFIHSGGLSLDNGAVAPLTQYFDLARLLGIPATSGAGYWDDSLEIEDKDWPTVEALLIEAKLLYKVSGQHQEWQNVQTDDVRRVLSRGAPRQNAVA